MSDNKSSTKSKKAATFWTICPYCYYMHEYSTSYKDCCLRCIICDRGFHGIPVIPPPQKGNNSYPCSFALFSTQYVLNDDLGGRKAGKFGQNEDIHGRSNSPVWISDDDDDSSGNGDNCKRPSLKSEGNVVEKCKKRVGSGYVKSVARNTKKMMGKGKKIIDI